MGWVGCHSANVEGVGNRKTSTDEARGLVVGYRAWRATANECKRRPQQQHRNIYKAYLASVIIIERMVTLFSTWGTKWQDNR